MKIHELVNKVGIFTNKYPRATIWTVLGVIVACVYLYNTRLRKVYDFRVIDGDTAIIYFEEWSGHLDMVEDVRFLDIDCYETKRTDIARWQAARADMTVEEVVKIGKESKQILMDLLNRHKDEIYFTGTYLPQYDRWHRRWGTLYINDVNVTEYMIAKGKCVRM